MNPMVSVIIPAYNVEDYIKESINSIKNQSFKDWELIVIDDGSTDATMAVAQECLNDIKDQSVKLVHQGNKGLSVARNNGLRMASGTYVYFLDSDDYIENNALNDLLKQLEQHNLDVLLFSATAFVDSNLSNNKEALCRIKDYQHYCDRLVDHLVISTGKKTLERMVDENRFIPSVPFAIYRRELLGDNPFTPGLLFEDNPFTIDTLIKAQRVGTINSKYYNRRIRIGSIMYDTTPDYAKRFKCRFAISEHVRQIYNSTEDFCLKNALGKLYIDYIRFASEDYKCREGDSSKPSELPNPESLLLYDAFFANRKPLYDMQNRADRLAQELEAVRSSHSFKIGVALTAFPRWIRSVLSI